MLVQIQPSATQLACILFHLHLMRFASNDLRFKLRFMPKDGSI